MLSIRIVAVGKLKERFWRDACEEYLKRLRPYASVEVVEVPDVSPDRKGVKMVLEEEARSIEHALPDGARVVLFDIDGHLVTSEDISQSIDKAAVEGTSRLCFVIGGSCGVSEEVRKRANERWSLGRITMPHNLARVVVLEQIYRAFKISHKEPYHK